MYTEASYENSLIELFQGMGYSYAYGPDVVRDYNSPLYEMALEDALYRLNPGLPSEAVSDALYKLHHFENGSLEQKNSVFMDYLQNGIEVKFVVDGEEKSDIVYLVDYKNPEKNSFIIANQWTFVENSNKRPDLIIFLNGLPVVLMELKSPSREQTDVSEAYAQLRNYMHEIPSMFIYNAILVMSDQATSKAGTITSGEDRFMEWKTKDGSYENTAFAQFDTFFEGMFTKERLLDIIKNFICYCVEGTKRWKVLAGYHQYFAVRKAVASTMRASGENGDGRGGVFWHTQGSGKSLSMVFYAHLLQEAMDSPTIVVITDRNDLDNQLYKQFALCKDFLRQTPIQAESRAHLKQLLENRQANGIFFSTMQKFEVSDEALSTRRNIVVMADEAHRGQYGLGEKVKMIVNEAGQKIAKIVQGIARIIRNSLPRATYIGFTGTPISLKDRSTKEVFGDYIDIYDMTQAVEDGATRPVYYESRVIKLKLDPEVLQQIDEEYARMIAEEEADEELVEASKKRISKMETLLADDDVINSLVCDILDHYETNREHLLTGKAMIVAYSRAIAMKIYNRILELRPGWTEKVAVVMTGSNKDPEEWHDIIGNDAHKAELAIKFKDNDSPLKIAIVVDMWLTGFDVPSLATMYVFKPMAGHNLMQAIARVNRVFQDKEGGLVVDYIGIAAALRQAMKDYTSRDQKNFGEMDVAKIAYTKFKEKLEVCRDQHGFDYDDFFGDSDLKRAKSITGAVNFIMGNGEEAKKRYIKEAYLLRQAFSLCSALAQKHERTEAAFFEACRVLILRLMGNGGHGRLSIGEINNQINEMLKEAIQSDGVINLFSDVKEEFSLFDPKLLEEIAKMKEKNIAVEILKKLLAEQVLLYKKNNVVKSEEFSQMLQRVLNLYYNGLLTNEQVIQEMLDLAARIQQAKQLGEELGLTEEEQAFYDALTRPEAIKDFYTNDQLVAMTKELTEMLRKNRTIDWEKRDDARAKMRMLVKKLLRKYKYPPEGMDAAMNTVLEQCELWTDNETATMHEYPGPVDEEPLKVAEPENK